MNIKKIGCLLGFHDWEIENHGATLNSGRMIMKYHRTCKHCDKREYLVRPKEYHPTLSVWESEKTNT